jgi:hypothetical protein
VLRDPWMYGVPVKYYAISPWIRSQKVGMVPVRLEVTTCGVQLNGKSLHQVNV